MSARRRSAGRHGAGALRWAQRLWQRVGQRLSTVRAQLTLLATAVVAAVLVMSAFGLVVVQRTVLTHGIDEALRQRADNIETQIAAGVYGRLLPNEGDREDSFLQVVNRQGRVVAATTNATSLPAVGKPRPAGSPQLLRTVGDVPLSNRDFRVLTRRIDRDASARTLIVAKNLDDVNESVQTLTTSLAISIPLVTALLAVLVWWLTGRLLRPVELIRSEVAGISVTDLDRRVPVPGSHDEISRLARTMNEMLQRLQEATDRQLRFVADASHELRGPLTRIRTDIEVGTAHPETVDHRDPYRGLLVSTQELQELLDDLLLLARTDAHAFGLPDTVVDLDDLVLAEARQLRARGRVQVDTGAVSAARVLGDAHQLARAIGNLATNAERHATTTVRFEVGEPDGRSRLVVADDGPGIPAEHRERVFERFARLDEARSRDAGGSGLGLAIVRDIVERHGGTITIASTDGPGARFVMTLPRAD